MKRVLLLAVALLALAASDAQAHTTIACDPCSYPYQQWVDEAKVPTPDVTITVVEQSCSESLACAYPAERVINFGGEARPRQTFYHELGHVFDFYVLPEWARGRYMGIMGETGAWEQPALLHLSPNESFAESYAFCALQPKITTGVVNGQRVIGGPRIYNRVCRLLARL